MLVRVHVHVSINNNIEENATRRLSCVSNIKRHTPMCPRHTPTCIEQNKEKRKKIRLRV